MFIDVHTTVLKASQNKNRAGFALCVKTRACKYVAAITVSAVIEINVFDYNVHVGHVRCASVAEVNGFLYSVQYKWRNGENNRTLTLTLSLTITLT